MEILVKRIAKKPSYTIGRLYVNGKLFSNTLEDTDRGLDQSMSPDEIAKKKIKDKTAIPTGTYRVTLDVVSPRFSKKLGYRWCGGKLPRLLNVPGYSGVLIHCLTPDTEILTEKGWQNLEQFKADPAKYCLSYNTETGKAEMVPVNFMIENDYAGTIYKNEGRRISYSVTDKHQMYAGLKKHDGSIVWEKREACEIPKNNVYFRTAAIKDGEKLLPHQKTLYRLLMATVADGYLMNWSAESSQVRFHFTKERKIERVKQLVEELGGSYKIFTDNVGKTHISLDSYLSEVLTEMLNPYRLIQKDKTLPWELLKLRGEDLKDLVMEYLFWDGRYENYLKNNKNMIISSTDTHNLDVLQAMATLGGLRSYIKDDNGKTDPGHRKTCFALSLYENQDIITPSPETFSTEEYSGKVWCLNNDNHTLIIRKNFRPMVIGNCGNTPEHTSGCILVGDNRVKGKVLDSMDTLKKLYKVMQDAKKKGEDIYITIE